MWPSSSRRMLLKKKKKAKIHSLRSHRLQLTKANKTCLRQVMRYMRFKYTCKQTPTALYVSIKKNDPPKPDWCHAWSNHCLWQLHRETPLYSIHAQDEDVSRAQKEHGVQSKHQQSICFQSYRFSAVLIIIKASTKIMRAWTHWI